MVNDKSATLPALGGIAALLAACLAGGVHAQATNAETPRPAEQKPGNQNDKDKEKELGQVNVTGDRERERTYQPGLTRIGKTPALPRDIPQSVTIVPESLMHDRSVDSFREALRNVPGITFNAGEGGRIGDNITLRGFSVVGDLYLDGIRDIAQYNRDTFNNEQIEVLRGSSSMLYGRGSTGGIINQVSKLPSVVDRTALGFTIGNYGYRRATVDTNQVVGHNMAIRLNAMKTEGDSFRDEVRTNRLGLAPSMRIGIGTANEFLVAHYHLQYNDIPDYGVPYFNGKPLDVPVTRFYGLANADRQKDRADISTLAYTRQIDAHSSLRTVLRHADYARDLWATAPRLAGAPAAVTEATVVNRQRQARGGDERNQTLQSDYNSKFEFGGLKHQLLLGIELARENAGRFNYAQAAGIANPSTTVGNPDPRPLLAAGYFSSISKVGAVTYRADTIGTYGQETLELTPQWKLVAGARFDRFKGDYARPEPQGPLTRTDRVWSTRAGLLFQPDDESSYYAAYGTSFNPSGELYALDDRGANTPPEKNRNLEIGAKWELFDGNLSFRAALFRSEKTNERNTDLSVSVEQNLLSGKRHTDGIEVEAAGRITPQWEVFAGAAHMSARIDAAAGQQTNTLGKVPINTPAYTASLWSVYKFSERWRAGAGLEAVGRRYANATNTNEVPAYRRADLMLSYESGGYAVRLNVLNAFDKQYYEGVYQGHSVPGTLRATQLTLEYKFF